MESLSEIEIKNREGNGVVSETEADRLRENLSSMLDSIKSQPSFFAKIAYFWGERSLLVKILIGLGLITPFIVIGILTQSIVFMVIATTVAATYTLFSRLLDNFFEADTELFKKLKEGIGSMGDLLGETINALNTVRQNLAEQVARFTDENQQLEVNNETLTKENERLRKQVNDITELAQKVQLTNEQISKSSETLLQTSTKNEKLASEKEALIQQMKQEHEAYVKKLSLEMEKLRLSNADFQNQLSEAQQNIELLKDLNANLDDVTSEHKGNTDAFINSVNNTLEGNGISMGQILTQVSSVGNRLGDLGDELLENLDKNVALLEQQQAQVTRMGAMLDNRDRFFAGNADRQNETKPEGEALGLH